MSSLSELANNVVIIFITEKNQILLVRDKRTSEWMLPGGHRDGNESEFEGALREFREETSFSIDPEYIINTTSHLILHKNGKKTKIYIIRSNQEFPSYNPKIVHNQETDKVYYLKIDDLKTLVETGLYQGRPTKLKSYNITSFNELIKLQKI